MSDIDRCPHESKANAVPKRLCRNEFERAFDAIVCVPSAGKDGLVDL